MKEITKEKAGVITYRLNEENELEVLLVSARKFKNSWVFPVGTVEKNETPRQAAARECAEESGYIVKLEEELGSMDIGDGNDKSRFIFFKAATTGRETEYENDRKRLWVNIKELTKKVAPVFIPFAENFIELISNREERV